MNRFLRLAILSWSIGLLLCAELVHGQSVTTPLTPVWEESQPPKVSRSYDGCNWTTCYEGGLCVMTSLWCGDKPIGTSVITPVVPLAPAPQSPIGTRRINLQAASFTPIDYAMYKDSFQGTGAGDISNAVNDPTNPHFTFIYADVPLDLPRGAVITRVSAYVIDNSPPWDATIAVNSSALDASDFQSCFASSSGYADTPYVQISKVCKMPVTDDRSYVARIVIPPAGPYIRIASVTVEYEITAPPAPITAAFSDVPTTHWAHRYVEAFTRSGLTSGCGGGNFCPDTPVTRAQLAVFLSQALGLGW